MPESKIYNDTNNVVISIVQNGNTYYPTETVRGDDQFEGPGMWVTVGYQSLFDLSNIDTNSSYILDDSYSLYRGDAVFIDKK